LHQLLEDHPVWDARSVATEWRLHVSVGKNDRELLLDGLLWMYGGTAGMERLLWIGELRELPA
jgi:hypothetical protein